MNRRRRTLPPVPPKAPSELRPLIAAMTEILETGEGVRGDPLDRKLTLRDILDSGIGKIKPGMRPGQDGNLDSGTLPPAPDLSIPPAPAGFDAQGGFYGMINLSWTIPGQQYRNHAYTNIFRNEEDNFANAEVIGREAGGFYTDYVRDDAVDPDDPTKLKGYYYWITFTSVTDIEGPPNSPSGTYSAPLADLGYVIELLTGEIDAGVLAQSLKEEIEKIPAIESSIERIGPIEELLRGPESLDGTVANRLAKEREQRIEALDDERKERIEGLTFEAQARAQALQQEVENRTTAINHAAEELELEDSLLALQQNVMAAAFDANAASIYSMAQIRINDSEVFASQIDQLFGNVSNNESLILNEQQIRIDQFSSLATQVGILSARLDARPSFASSFEPGSDFDAWAVTAGSTLTPETSDIYAGLQAALVTSSLPSADPIKDGVRRLISEDTTSQFSGNEIRVSFYAKQPSANASTEFAIAYCVDGVLGEWARFTPNSEYTFHDMLVDVPADTEDREHSLVIWGDTSGTGKGVLIDRVLATFSETEIPEVTAAIEQIQQALADQEQAVASQLQGFLSRLNDNTASIERETETRSTQYDALASDVATMTALTEQNVADIAAEREAWSSAVEAVVTDVLDMSARVDDAEGRITSESSVRATEDDLLAAVQRVMSASRGAASATFYSLEEMRTTESQASALRIDGIEVQLANARSAIEQTQELLAEEDRALAKQIEAVSAALGDDLSSVQQIFESEVSRLDGRVDTQSRALTIVQSRLDEDISTVRQDLSSSVSRIDGALNANAKAILDVQSASEEALAGAAQAFDTEVNRVDGRIDAAARSLTEVRSELGEDVAGVQQKLNTEVSRLDGRINSTSQSITIVQSQLGSQLSTVQQDFSTEIIRVNGEIESTARLVQSVQTDLGNGLNAVEIKAVTNSGGILSNGQFATGDLSGWGDTWSGVSVVEAGPGGSGATQDAPTKYIARWTDSGHSSEQYMRGERFAAIAGDAYTFKFSYASGGGSRNIDAELRVGWVTSTGSISYQTIHSQNVTSTGWNTTPLLRAIAPAGTVEAWVYFRRAAGGSGELYLADVRATRPDMVAGAQWTAQVQSNGLIGGFGIYNDGVEVDAGFDVGRFWIGRTNSNKRKPFIIDGIETYIDTAMIRNGSIQEGQLGPISIGKFFMPDGTPVTTVGGLIRAEAIDVDNLSVAEAARFYGDVQNGNFITGSRGWRIRQNGNVEFNQGLFRGVAQFTSGNLGDDVTINNTDSLALIRERAYAGELAKTRAYGWTRPNSTSIDGNKIYTGDAYVDTLEIKGEAVTAVASSHSSGGVVVSTEDGWKVVQSVWVAANSTGSPVNIKAIASYEVAWTIGNTINHSLRARLIDTSDGSELGSSVLFDRSPSTSSYASAGAIVLAFRVPSNWNGKTVELQVLNSGGGTAGSGANYVVSNRNMEGITVKR